MRASEASATTSGRPRSGSRPGSACGLLPWAPGSWASLAALPLAWLLMAAGGLWLLLAAALVVFLVGIWAAERYMAAVGIHDPTAVVIDEIAGQWLTLCVAPLDPLAYALGFVLFRIFDVLKPWPVELARPPRRRRLRRDDRRHRRGALCRRRALAARPLAAAMTFAPASLALARRVLAACQARGLRLATAESCTGGLIAACLTEIAGSSSVVERGYVTYDNRAKQEMLGVARRCCCSASARSARRSRWRWPQGRARAPASTSRSRSPASPARAARPPPSRSAWSTSRSPRDAPGAPRAPPASPATARRCGGRASMRRSALILRSLA